MEKLTVEYLPITELKEYKHNAKEHPEEQVEQIAKSILTFGMNDPIAIDEDGTIIEGHGRLMAIKKLKKAGEYEPDTVPVIRLTHLTDQQKKAYILAHNKLTMNTGFDTSILDEELDKITEFDMGDYGFVDIDFSYIDDLLKDGFDTAKNDKEHVNDTFDSTFLLPLDYKEIADKYLSTKNAKEELVEAIIARAYEEA